MQKKQQQQQTKQIVSFYVQHINSMCEHNVNKKFATDEISQRTMVQF